MITLGIESTCHTFGVGIIEGKNIRANRKASYTTEKGGIIPMEAAKHHEKYWLEIINQALEEAKITEKEVDIITYARGPGIGPCLRVGLKAAEYLKGRNKKVPVVGVNHCLAHLSVGSLISDAKDPVFLYASGANTQIIALEGGKYRIFGETLDMGCGNFLDSFARVLGLGFPGGPKIAEMAKKGEKFIELPYVVKGMDVSFSGLFTNLKQKVVSGSYKPEDLAYSVQETVFSMLMEVSERAMAHCEKKELILGGGVCCNERLQDMAKKMCNQRDAKCYIPERPLLLDNGAMIAWQGYLERKKCCKQDRNKTL